MKLKRISRTTVALLVVIALLTSALGYFMLQRQVGTHFYVRPSFNLMIFDIDATTELTFIEMAELDKNVEKWFPGGHDGYYGWTPYGTYFCNNTNEMTLYIGITVEGAPAGMTFKFVIWRLDKSQQEIIIDTTSPTEVMYEYPLEGSISADPLLEGLDRACRWYLVVTASSEVPGEAEYTATLVFNAYSTPTG